MLSGNSVRDSQRLARKLLHFYNLKRLRRVRQLKLVFNENCFAAGSAEWIEHTFFADRKTAR
jgi:hypothetical protein